VCDKLLDLGRHLGVAIAANHPTAVKLIGQVQSTPLDTRRLGNIVFSNASLQDMFFFRDSKSPFFRPFFRQIARNCICDSVCGR
jgi:hypothetical protein